MPNNPSTQEPEIPSFWGRYIKTFTKSKMINEMVEPITARVTCSTDLSR
ncbi:hypothetical protein [Lamprocystis purpurea]|jgi:hypothetical protein|nr:hypothetical protein [Lamprocystis purpurea]